MGAALSRPSAAAREFAAAWCFPAACAAGAGAAAVVAIEHGYERWFAVASAMNFALGLSLLVRQHQQMRDAEDRMPLRAWMVNLGLMEGYDVETGKVHAPADAVAAYLAWLAHRRANGLSELAGGVAPTTNCYSVRNVAVAGAAVAARGAVAEPSVVISCNLSPHYDKNKTDAEVLETLVHMTSWMMVRLGQRRGYLTWCGVQRTIARDQIAPDVVAAATL